MKIINSIGIFLIILFTTIGCDDSLGDMGFGMVPDSDGITSKQDSLNVTSIKSLIVGDAINAKTSVAYLGKYTDPDTNTKLESDFLAQVYCKEGFEFPDNIKNKEAIRVVFRMYYSTYFGDSLNSCRVNLYPLNKVLEDGKNYYTDIDPTEYYDTTLSPIATKDYTAVDYSISDSARTESGYYKNVAVTLPVNFGTDIIQKFYETNASGDSIGKGYFKNPYQFIHNVCKGFYVKCERGDGTILNIDQAQLEIYFQYYAKSSTGLADSLVTAAGVFGATDEVIQANKFQNSGLQQYVNTKMTENAAVLRTPAGVFSEVTLPLDQVSENDTLNSAQITFRRYNSLSSAKYQMNIPENLLMIRKSDLDSFFDNNKIYDNKTSYRATYDSKYGQYTFDNISNLIRYCQWLRREGLKTDSNWETNNPDWNKVLLVPVTYATATVNNGSTTVVTKVRHDLQLGNACIKTDDVKLKLIYSSFNNK